MVSIKNFLYSHCGRMIPNSFCGAMFNRHRLLVESCEVDPESSNIYFFLPSITNRAGDTNQQVKSLRISSIDIKQEQLSVWVENTLFQTLTTFKTLTLFVLLTSYFSGRKVDTPVDWVGGSKLRSTSGKLNLTC